MSGTQNDDVDETLPERFDEQVQLEIEDGADREHPLVRMRDTAEQTAWVAASIEVVRSLSEWR